MNFAATALILGCSALACKFVVQSNPSNPNDNLEAPAIMSTASEPVKHFGFSLPVFTRAKTATTPPPAATEPQKGPTKEEAIELIHIAAAKHGVSANFVKSIVAVESNFNYAALSPKGAVGFMQLMPATAEELGADPNIPEQNIDAGTRYLRQLMDRYQRRRNSLKHVIAAYNAGPGMVDRYRGVPPFPETRKYVTRVLNFLRQFEASDRRS